MIAVAAIFVAVVAMSAAVMQQRDRNWWRDQARAARDEARDAELDRDERNAAAVEVAGPAAWLDTKVRHRIIVHTIDERSYEGLLELSAEDGVILVGTRMLTEGGMQVAGEVFIPRSQVLFVQLPRGEGD